MGTDIAELLLSEAEASPIQTPSAPATPAPPEPTCSNEQVTGQFRQYLLYGNTKEALGILFYFILFI